MQSIFKKCTGPRLLAVIPIGFAAMVVNLTSKDIPRNVDPVSGVNLKIVHSLWIVFNLLCALAGQ